MKTTKTTLRTIMRWLVVLMTSLVVLSAPVFAGVSSVSQEKCQASCAKRCPCCVSRPAPTAPIPTAPTVPRVAVEKSFQLAPVVLILLPPPYEFSTPSILGDASTFSRRDAPLYQRHCTYLI